MSFLPINKFIAAPNTRKLIVLLALLSCLCLKAETPTPSEPQLPPSEDPSLTSGEMPITNPALPNLPEDVTTPVAPKGVTYIQSLQNLSNGRVVDPASKNAAISSGLNFMAAHEQYNDAKQSGKYNNKDAPELDKLFLLQLMQAQGVVPTSNSNASNNPGSNDPRQIVTDDSAKKSAASKASSSPSQTASDAQSQLLQQFSKSSSFPQPVPAEPSTTLDNANPAPSLDSFVTQLSFAGNLRNQVKGDVTAPSTEATGHDAAAKKVDKDASVSLATPSINGATSLAATPDKDSKTKTLYIAALGTPTAKKKTSGDKNANGSSNLASNGLTSSNDAEGESDLKAGDLLPKSEIVIPSFHDRRFEAPLRGISSISKLASADLNGVSVFKKLQLAHSRIALLFGSLILSIVMIGFFLLSQFGRRREPVAISVSDISDLDTKILTENILPFEKDGEFMNDHTISKVVPDRIEQIVFNRSDENQITSTETKVSEVGPKDRHNILRTNDGKWDIYASQSESKFARVGQVLPGSTVKAKVIAGKESDSGFFILTEGQRWIPTEAPGKCIVSVKHETFQGARRSQLAS